MAAQACLPLFSPSDQKHLYSLSNNSSIDEFNNDPIVSNLLQEIKRDKPSFVAQIIPSDIRKNIVVMPSRKNKRIIKQAGAFIICGLFDEADNIYPLENLRYCETSAARKLLLLIIKNKQDLLNELQAVDIHRAALFPEIDDVADY